MRKNRTKQEILADFKSEILPELRMHRLVKMQAAIKGWYTRKVIIPRKKIWNRIIEDYAVRKLNEFLEDSIIPETAIEVLKSNVTSRDITLYSASMRGDLEYLDEFIARVVAKFTREAVTEVID